MVQGRLVLAVVQAGAAQCPVQAARPWAADRRPAQWAAVFLPVRLVAAHQGQVWHRRRPALAQMLPAQMLPVKPHPPGGKCQQSKRRDKPK